jgi:hypothetical protein
MIVWLASYPRSGNTMLRILLHRVFALSSTDVHGSLEPSRTVEQWATTPLRRHYLEYGYLIQEDVAAFLAQARESAGPVLVKTHDPPADDSPAIYVVRDGRAAIASYRHYLKDFDGVSASLDAVLRGAVGMGAWSAHLASWQPLTRPRTLLVRFEDVIAKPQAVIAALARFLDRAPVAEWSNPNRALQAIDSSFFRGGSNARGIAEWSPADMAVFWELHGAWMARLGYARAPRLRFWWSRLRARIS